MQYLKHVEVPVVQDFVSKAIVQQALTQCQDYTALDRRPNNEWTYMQRVILGWLKTSYSNSWRDVAKILNACFTHELPTQEGLSKEAIATMWNHIRLSADEQAAIAALQACSSQKKSTSFHGMTRSLVRRIARELGIELLEKKHEPMLKPMQSRQSQLKKRKATFPEEPESDEASEVSFTSTDTRECLQTPKKSRIGPFLQTPRRQDTQNATAAYPTPPSKERQTFHWVSLAAEPPSHMKIIQAPRGKRLAALGFRAFCKVRKVLPIVVRDLTICRPHKDHSLPQMGSELNFF